MDDDTGPVAFFTAFIVVVCLILMLGVYHWGKNSGIKEIRREAILDGHGHYSLELGVLTKTWVWEDPTEE